MRHDSYAWRGGREAMLRFGEDSWPTFLVLPPLFEEANRTRATLVALMRFLANGEDPIASILPDLPGTGDSPIATVDARFEDWADAINALAETLPRPRLTLAVRGGALLDACVDADARYRLEPVDGARLLRDMVRATSISSDLKTSELEARARLEPTRLAGNLIHPALFDALHGATVAEVSNVRTARLGPGGDVELLGAPVWRRAEPDMEWAQVADMAEDVFCWVNRCATR